MRAMSIAAVVVWSVLAGLLLTAATGCHGNGVKDAADAQAPRNAALVQSPPPMAATLRGEHDVSTSSMDALFTGSEAPENTAAAGTNPDSWHVITRSLSLFTHPPYVMDLLLGFVLAIIMALMLTAWPRSLVPRDPVAARDERNGALIVALVGCTAAELVQSSEQLALGAEIALVLFGIGGLIRFRTVFGDPRRTGLMIMVTVLGLSCGMSQYALAVLGFLVVWLVRYFLLASATLVVRVRLRRNADPEQVRTAAASLVAGHGVTVVRSEVRRGGRLVELQGATRGVLDEEDLRQALEDALPGARVKVTAS